MTTHKPIQHASQDLRRHFGYSQSQQAALPYCDIAKAEVRAQPDTKYARHAPGSAQTLVCGGCDNVSILKW
jgi:hypothetical protein